MIFWAATKVLKEMKLNTRAKRERMAMGWPLTDVHKRLLDVQRRSSTRSQREGHMESAAPTIFVRQSCLVRLAALTYRGFKGSNLLATMSGKEAVVRRVGSISVPGILPPKVVKSFGSRTPHRYRAN